MSTTALLTTGDYLKILSKHALPPNHALPQKKILLIDDQSDTSLFTALQQEGYEVIAVESPQHAWGVVSSLRPHFIIIHLKDVNRWDVSTLQGCGVLAGGIPIIIAAPLPGSGTFNKALEKVAPVYLSFPMGPYGIGEILHDLDMADGGMWTDQKPNR